MQGKQVSARAKEEVPSEVRNKVKRKPDCLQVE
jgi:hypothetical protein